ncbi:hypothetical protein B0H67DRAFT_686033 [Lasiosphaeris hirsuta]|uniref:Rhodopsin domain-containing protein n=1 Tax=Lasiosphaeris hirsuta TaxID=260670 RepID=A0AA40A211_9PEZI|nr:hypothetical protein B0H67DRAFT_686033 [Lasiosphaeris hirsuta]
MPFQLEDRIAAPLAWGCVAITLATIFVILRFVSRGYILRVLGPTDWAIATSLIISLLFTVVTVFEINAGYGYHVWEVEPAQLEAFYKMLYFAVILYSLAIVATKVSILLLYLDVFSATAVRKATYAVLAAVAIWGTWTVFSSIFRCWPIYAFWHHEATENMCFPRIKWTVDNGIHITLDFIIFVLPLPVIRSMTLPVRQKLWLYFVFALGFLVCLVTAIRIYYSSRIVFSDSTWQATIAVILSFIELSLSIAIPCIITLKPLVDRVFPRLLARKGPRSHRFNFDGSPRDDESIYPPTISSPTQRLARRDLEMQEVRGK